MTDKPDVGRNVYNALIQRGRCKTQAGREALRRMAEDAPGPQTMSMLIARAALALGEIEAVLTELHQIGQYAKSMNIKRKDER
jgi:hypothetical protein